MVFAWKMKESEVIHEENIAESKVVSVYGCIVSYESWFDMAKYFRDVNEQIGFNLVKIDQDSRMKQKSYNCP